jgi:hypothetical protein
MMRILKYALPIAAALVLGAGSGEAGVTSAARAQASAFEGLTTAVTHVHYRKKKHWRKHAHKRHKKRYYAYHRYHRHPHFHYWGPPVVYYWVPRHHYYWGGPSLIYRRTTYWYYDDCWPGRWCY